MENTNTVQSKRALKRMVFKGLKSHTNEEAYESYRLKFKEALVEKMVAHDMPIKAEQDDVWEVGRREHRGQAAKAQESIKKLLSHNEVEKDMIEAEARYLHDKSSSYLSEPHVERNALFALERYGQLCHSVKNFRAHNRTANLIGLIKRTYLPGKAD